ncbi:MAG: GatB/YqeY domain-containing protein [Desulfuromonadales bacterium]|nr:GatB/YqeY domain-containing protein [Desulfuromonadales bacterium]
MGLQERLTGEMKDAMRAKDSLRLSAIRLILTAIKNREIEARQPLDDQEIIGVLSTLVKQRKESAQIFRDNDRPELADKEEAELAVIQGFLPTQLSRQEIEAIIEEAVAQTGAASIKDMGKVMKIVAGRTTGIADGREVSELVKARLAR